MVELDGAIVHPGFYPIGDTTKPMDLIDYAGGFLPSAIPEKIEILSDFPRTNTGKTQKNKLREMFSKN